MGILRESLQSEPRNEAGEGCYSETKGQAWTQEMDRDHMDADDRIHESLIMLYFGGTGTVTIVCWPQPCLSGCQSACCLGTSISISHSHGSIVRGLLNIGPCAMLLTM